jgi:epoxyqueuosine reductase
MAVTSADRDWIQAQARSVGFDLAGLAAVPDTQDALEEDRRFAEWIAAGNAGEMEYLKRSDDAGNLLRSDLRRTMPWARSVLVCALNYNAAIGTSATAGTNATPLSIDPAAPTAGWIARYAWSGKPARPGGGARETGPSGNGADYHDILLPRLRALERALQQRFGPTLTTRAYVDTGPLLERGFAARAGVGWIGKNTCILNQQQGSWLLLGVVVTSLEIAPEAAAIPAADRCGSCTRCIDACPTQAILTPSTPNSPRQMDASRCIAYLTIEKKGSIPEDLRAPMGRQVFGCDICQDVCPWNRRAPIAASDALQPRPELINPALAWLASLEGPDFTQVFRGSPIERTRRQTSRRKLLRRNVAIAMGNSGEHQFLPQLQAWVDGEDAMLAEHAAWAIARLTAKSRSTDPK